MKKLLLFIVVVFSLSSFAVFKPAGDYNFVGKWTGIDEAGRKGGFIFDEEGYVTFIMDGETMGGKEGVIDGKKVSMKYEINQSTSAVALDIIMESQDQKMTARFLIKIIDKNKIVVAGNMNDVRPKAITSKNSITLTRE